MVQNNMTEVNVFAALQHGHTAARSVRTRHYRNGQELSPIIDESNYDFNFQQTRTISPMIKVQKVRFS